MVRKIQDGQILSRNRIYHLYKSVPFTEKRPQSPENGIKDGFEEMGHEISVWNISVRNHRTTFSDVRCSQTFSDGKT